MTRKKFAFRGGCSAGCAEMPGVIRAALNPVRT